MAHDCTDARTLDQELAVARNALADGDPVHAAHHLGIAAQIAPNDAQLTALIDELVDAVGDVEPLVPLTNERALSQVVLRALVLARVGRCTDAWVDAILASSHAPQAGYIEAVLRAPLSDAALSGMDADRIGDALVRAVGREELLAPNEVDALRPSLLSICDLLGPRHTASESLAFAESMIARRLGDAERALRAVRHRYTGPASYRVAIATANAHRAEGRVDDAIGAYQHAIALDPDDAAARLDAGDTLFSRGRLAEARTFYEAARRVDPNNDWAVSSIAGVDALLADDAAALEALRERAVTSQRASYLLSLSERYATWLPDRPEACLKALDAAAARADELIKMSVSSLEAPSAVALLRRHGPSIELTFGPCKGFDPRVPRRPITFELWKYRRRARLPFSGLTDVARPALDVPDRAVAAAIAELAQLEYEGHAWFDAARSIAVDIGPARVRDVLACMVHPTRAAHSDGAEEARWVFQLQVAAAMVIARIDIGWEGSHRRAALTSLLDGPVDWVTSAGIIAATQLAIEEPSLAPPIVAALTELAQLPVVPIVHMCIHEPVVFNLLRVPCVVGAFRESLRERRLELLFDDA